MGGSQISKEKKQQKRKEERAWLQFGEHNVGEERLRLGRGPRAL